MKNKKHALKKIKELENYLGYVYRKSKYRLGKKECINAYGAINFTDFLLQEKLKEDNC